jgi:CRP-like cAMP-binding protein
MAFWCFWPCFCVSIGGFLFLKCCFCVSDGGVVFLKCCFCVSDGGFMFLKCCFCVPVLPQGEAKVFVETTDESGSSSTMKVNELFRADFFGERALLKDEPRMASVIVSSAIPMKCLVLARKDFVEILGPLQELMEREKSTVTTNKRMKELSGDLKHKKVSVILKRTSPRLGAVQIVCKGSAEEMLLLAKQNSGGNVVRAQRDISAAFYPQYTFETIAAGG